MSKEDIERRLDLAAALALSTRDRIEAAVSSGEVPSWVQDACNVLERASVQYGELSEQLKPSAGDEPEPERIVPLFTLQSLTIH
jgi:hypothetical protein